MNSINDLIEQMLTISLFYTQEHPYLVDNLKGKQESLLN